MPGIHPWARRDMPGIHPGMAGYPSWYMPGTHGGHTTPGYIAYLHTLGTPVYTPVLHILPLMCPVGKRRGSGLTLGIN